MEGCDRGTQLAVTLTAAEGAQRTSIRPGVCVEWTGFGEIKVGKCVYTELSGGGIVRAEFLRGRYDWLGYSGGEKEPAAVKFGIRAGREVRGRGEGIKRPVRQGKS